MPFTDANLERLRDRATIALPLRSNSPPAKGRVVMGATDVKALLERLDTRQTIDKTCTTMRIPSLPLKPD